MLVFRCSELDIAQVPLRECVSESGSSYQFGRCDSPALDPPANPGLPGILPPLNDGALSCAPVAILLLFALMV